MAITVTEKAAAKVKQIIEEQRDQMLQEHRQQQAAADGGTATAVEAPPVPEKIYLRLRVVGGGCSGFQNKLDLDPQVNEKLDEVFEVHGLPVAVDKRSLMYLDNATVDFHDDLNKRGFSISNPQAKSTCGCGSSYSM